MTDQQNAHERDEAVQKPNDSDDLVTYFTKVVARRIEPEVDTGDSSLFVHELFSGPEEPRRFRLRLKHPDTCESDLSVAYDAGEFEAFLRGLEAGSRGDVETKSHGTAEREGVEVE